jgi:hypothetical protein
MRLAKTIAISGSIERKGSRTNTKVYGAPLKADPKPDLAGKARKDIAQLCSPSCASERDDMLRTGCRRHDRAGSRHEPALQDRLR